MPVDDRSEDSATCNRRHHASTVSPMADASGTKNEDYLEDEDHDHADTLQYPLYSLPIEECVYRGEGNANLVVAVPSEGKVIRLRKSPIIRAEDGSAPSRRERREEERAETAARLREVDFYGAVISGYLGGYARAPEILRLDPRDIDRLAEKIRADRPEERRVKDIVGPYATRYPDYSLLPENLRGLSSKPTFCVEIKPKQGFLSKINEKLKKCPYCLMQYYKTSGVGGSAVPSSYCPLDLFSGEPARMGRALAALARSPQNNLRVFRDGELVYGEQAAGEARLRRLLASWFHRRCAREVEEEEQQDEAAFLRLLGEALARPFEDAEEEGRADEVPVVAAPRANEDGAELVERAGALLRLAHAQECKPGHVSVPVPGSVLGRILRMQRLHRRGLDEVAWIAAKLAGTLRWREGATYADLEALVGRRRRAADDASSSESEICTDSQDVKESRLRDSVIQKQRSKEKFDSTSDFSVQNQPDVDQQKKPKDLYSSILTLSDCMNILKNYLLFCTARDCSILMAFQEVDKDLSRNVEPKHRIDLFDDQSFLVSVRVLDLDMKPLSCIEKHVCRDKKVLEATISELEKKLASCDNEFIN